MLQPPCDCWTFGRAAVVEAARSVADALAAPPLVHAWLDAIEADEESELPSIGLRAVRESVSRRVEMLLR